MRARVIFAGLLTAVVILPLVSIYTRAAAARDEAPKEALAPQDVLSKLKEGNKRWEAGTNAQPHQDAARRHEQVAGHQPFAAVLACADSRVPVEMIFDVGIGDLFVVRVAGNVSDVDEIGSLEYGVEHLGIGTVVVLGHSKCGAVTAVVNHDHLTPNIELLVDNIVPAAKKAHEIGGPDELSTAIKLNVTQSIQDLQTHSELIKKAVADKKLQIVGGI